MRKIIDGIAIASGVGLLAIFGSGAYSYFWFQNNKDTLKQNLIEQVTGSIDVAQLFGTVIYSVESNFIISAGETVNKYFQRYPSPLPPALDGSKSVKFGSSAEIFPFGLDPVDPLEIQT